MVGEAATGEDRLRIVALDHPRVALVDVLMPGIGGVEATRRIRQTHPATQVVVLTSSNAQAHTIRAVKAGAITYLNKVASAEQILTAIRLAANGRSTPPRDGAAATRRRHDRPGAGLEQLTERELQVLRCIADGQANAIIGELLTITEGTVRTHVNSILTKLTCRDRTQAAVLAWREGVVDPPD